MKAANVRVANVSKRLVLLGAGHAHLHVLAALQQSPLIGTTTRLVTPCAEVVYSGMVPGLLAGHYTQNQCSVPLAPLLQAAHLPVTYASCVALDAQAQTLQVAHSGQPGKIETIAYDLLSINTGSVMDCDAIDQQIPGAKQHAVFVRPMAQFVQLWPSVLARAAHQSLQISVIGAGAGGIELAMALQHRLPHCQVTLIAGMAGPGSSYPLVVQRRIAAALAKQRIKVLPNTCIQVAADHLQLDNSTSVPCDLALLTIGGHAPAWLANSGLALDAKGYLATNAYQQSTSHSNVFGAGDVATRLDTPHPKSGVFAVRAGPVLQHNLGAALAGRDLMAHRIEPRTLNLISCGSRTAIASWGPITAQGQWVWALKNAIDQRWLRRYRVIAL